MTSLTLAKLNSLHLNIEFAAMFLVLLDNKCSFRSNIESFTAINYSDSFFSWAQNKSFKLTSHVPYCVPVLSSKLIGTKGFAFKSLFIRKCLSNRSKHRLTDTIGCLIQEGKVIDFWIFLSRPGPIKPLY